MELVQNSMKQTIIALLCLIGIFNHLSAQELQDWGQYEPIKEEAIQRIEQHRKGDITLKVTLLGQETAANTQVRVKLRRHDFKWGAVVARSFVTSNYSENYKETFLKYFNASGFNIALKPKHRNTENERIAAEQTMPWFIENDIYVRGHALTWEGINYMRLEDKAIANDASLGDKEKGEKLLESLSKHFTHAIPKWDVKCWDVTNEPIANNAVNQLFPDMNTHTHWFKLADSVRQAHGKKDVVLYANDYQIISAISPWALEAKKAGYNAVGRPALYREMLDEQISAGAPIEAIGFQSRIKHGLITPDTIYKRLCDFERYNLPYHATEFEIRDDASKYVYTTAERRLLTEYMMVMYFSHPNVKGFWHWTFADGNSNNVLAYPLFNYDGTPKVNGQIWMNLMDGFLTTDVTSATNADGEIDLRGYYGDYQITAELDGKTLTGTFEIDSTNTSPTIVVNLFGDPTTSVPEIKKKQNNKVLIRQNINQRYVEIQVDLETFQTKQVQIECYDFQGRKLHQRELTKSNTRISMNELNGKGLSIGVVREINGGTRLASEKINLL